MTLVRLTTREPHRIVAQLILGGDATDEALLHPLQRVDVDCGCSDASSTRFFPIDASIGRAT